MYYKNKSNGRRPQRNNHSNRQTQYLLPPVSLLEQYEALVPGSSEKIVDMVDIEQDHRHKWENKALHAYVWSYRVGQFCSVISLVAIIYMGIYVLQTLNNQKLAFTIIILGFLFHFVVALLSIKRKKFFSRPFKNHNSRFNKK